MTRTTTTTTTTARSWRSSGSQPPAGHAGDGGPEASLPRLTTRRRRKRPGLRRNEVFWGYAFIAPTALGLAVFYLWPTLRTFYLSFTESGPFGGSRWAGLDNYRTMLGDDQLLETLRNTFVYTGIVLLGIPLAIVIAAMLNQKGLRLVGLYRVLYFLPVVTMPAAVALVWRAIYHGDYGVLNYALRPLGVHGASWLTDPHTALYAVAAVGIWMSLGSQVVILLAGLQGVPTELYEAAELDGAGRVRQFFSVTLPLLTPSIFFVSVLSVINALQVFDLVFMMLGSGTSASPALPSAQPIVYLFYQQGFIENHRGYAAAIAFVLFAIVLVLTATQFRLQKKWVHYV